MNYWRATNRKDEIDDVKNGIEIISRNHADGHTEEGMSVSTGLGTAWCGGYKYIYSVSGDVVAYGSDGEPVLRNVKAISKNMSYAKAKKLHDKLMKNDTEYHDINTHIQVGRDYYCLADIKESVESSKRLLTKVTDKIARKIHQDTIDKFSPYL